MGYASVSTAEVQLSSGLTLRCMVTRDEGGVAQRVHLSTTHAAAPLWPLATHNIELAPGDADALSEIVDWVRTQTGAA